MLGLVQATKQRTLRLADTLVRRVERSPLVVVRGELLGFIEHRQTLGTRRVEIVHVTQRLSPDGPAENALVRVTHFVSRPTRAEYISWIGYADLDQANREDPRWQLVEPATVYQASVDWHPYG